MLSVMKNSVYVFVLTNGEEKKNFNRTVKPVYNDHPWDPKIVAVVDRWSLFRGSFVL